MRRWIVDGIDGTVVYVNGGTGWGTEIALELDGRVVVGVSSSPASGRRWYARVGGGARAEGSARAGGARAEGSARAGGRKRAGRGERVGSEQLSTSTTSDFSGATFTMIPPLEAVGDETRRHLRPLVERCTYVPPDVHGALLVCEARADLCLQLGGGPWDYAALSLIVAEAGGRFSDMDGAPRIDGWGPALYSNGVLHDEALAVLAGGEKGEEGDGGEG